MSHDNQNEPYRIGKGKPPKEHQFKKGQPSPNPKGRPKGSTRQSQLQKLLKKKVWVTGPDGRSVRKTLQEVIDHKLVQAAANGDLKAIKLIHEIAIMHERFSRSVAPSREELKRQMAEEEEKERLTEELRKSIGQLIDFMAALKKYGIIEFHSGNPCVQTWALDAAAAQYPNSGFARHRRLQKERMAAAGSSGPVDEPVEKPRG